MIDRQPTPERVLFVESDGSRWIAPEFDARKEDREAYGHLVGVDPDEYQSLLEELDDDEEAEFDPQEEAEFTGGSSVFALLLSPSGDRLAAVLIGEEGEDIEHWDYTGGALPDGQPYEGPEVIGARLQVGSRHDAWTLAATPLDPSLAHTTYEDGYEFRVDSTGRFHHAFGPARYGHGERSYVLHGEYVQPEEYARLALACAIEDGHLDGRREMDAVTAEWLSLRVEHELDVIFDGRPDVDPVAEAILRAATIDNVEEISIAMAPNDGPVDFAALASKRGWTASAPMFTQ